MNVLFICILVYCLINGTFARIEVSKVIVRIPRPKDIGLIFDLTVVNTLCKEKETLEFRIRSDGTCCVNLTEQAILKNAGRVVGGNFGHIEPGTAEVVSLIWPTVSLYNRVGSCPIIITSINAAGTEKHERHAIIFDTRFTTLDPEGRTLRSRPDYKDCKNWDKEYLKNCTPVVCEERYFGQRSFYNKTTEHCDEVPCCNKRNMHYNFIDNECVDMMNFFTKEDLRKIRYGEFVDEYPHQEQNTLRKCRKKIDSLYQLYDEEAHENAKRAADDFDVEFKRYMRSKFVEPTGLLDLSTETKRATNDDANETSYMPYWLKGVLEGFLVVFATVAIYIFICFVIFLIVTWISRRQSKGNATSDTCALRSPAPSDCGDEHTVITPSSLLSQR